MEAVLAEITAAYGAYMQVRTRLNSYCDYRRHGRDDPALQALVLAADRVAHAGVPDPVPAPPLVVDEVA